jgi:hypothetical protein
MLAATRRASSLVSSFAAARRPGLSALMKFKKRAELGSSSLGRSAFTGLRIAARGSGEIASPLQAIEFAIRDHYQPAIEAAAPARAVAACVCALARSVPAQIHGVTPSLRRHPTRTQLYWSVIVPTARHFRFSHSV